MQGGSSMTHYIVVEKHPNVFIDTAAYLDEIPPLPTMETVQRLGGNKIIFRWDYPMPFGDQVHRMKDFVDCVSGLDLPERVREKILCHNVEHPLREQLVMLHNVGLAGQGMPSECGRSQRSQDPRLFPCQDGAAGACRQYSNARRLTQ